MINTLILKGGTKLVHRYRSIVVSQSPQNGSNLKKSESLIVVLFIFSEVAVITSLISTVNDRSITLDYRDSLTSLQKGV